MSRPKERDEQEALKLDELFKNCLARVKPYILALTASEDVQLCRLWLDKLSYASSQRALRNQYLVELCRQVESGHVGGLFANPPPNGQLLPLYKTLPMVKVPYTKNKQDIQVNGSSSWSELSDASTLSCNNWSKPHAKSVEYNKTPTRKHETDSTSTGHCGRGKKITAVSRFYDGVKLEKNQLVVFEQRVHTLTSIVKELQIQNERLNQELIRYQQNSTVNETSHLQSTIRQLTAEITTLKAKLMEVQKMKDSIEINHQEIMEQYKKSTSDQITRLNARLQELQSINITLENNLISMTQKLEKLTRVKEEEIHAVKSEYSRRMASLQEQHENSIKQKDEELEKKDALVSQKMEELGQIEEKNTEIDNLNEEIRELKKKLEMKKDHENNLKAIVTEQCAAMQQEFTKMRLNMEMASQKQSHCLATKIANLKRGILKLEKSKEKLAHECERKIYHILKDKEIEIKALQLQLQGQRSELSMTLSSEKQCELDTLVGSLEERYRSLLAATDGSPGNYTKTYITT